MKNYIKEKTFNEKSCTVSHVTNLKYSGPMEGSSYLTDTSVFSLL